MADSTTNQPQNRKQGALTSRDRENRENRGLQRWDPAWNNPFEFIDRMSEEMDRLFDRVSRGFGFSRSLRPGSSVGSIARPNFWAPRIEAFQKGDRFIVRAELPGLKKDEVDVELTDDVLTIRGERKHEQKDEREGYYHTEREYGEFYRTIPLPEGVIAESAQANFRDGVLEVSMQAAPSEANRGRKLEIKEGDSSQHK